MKAGKFLHFTGVLAVALVPMLLMCQPVTSLAASNPGGVVMGKVSGHRNAAVPGARDVLFNFRTRTRRETWSDEAGNYVFRDVPPGE